MVVTSMGGFVPRAVTAPRARVGLPVVALRLAMAAVFLFAFADRLLGLHHPTPGTGAWASGDSPTRRYAETVGDNAVAGVLRSWAGHSWADWSLMAALAGVGTALALGVALRVAAVIGSAVVLVVVAASGVSPHLVVYLAALVVVAAAHAGDRWGLGKRWSATLSRWRRTIRVRW